MPTGFYERTEEYRATMSLAMKEAFKKHPEKFTHLIKAGEIKIVTGK